MEFFETDSVATSIHSSSVAQSSINEELSLWVEQRSPDGHIYYYNTRTQRVQVSLSPRVKGLFLYTVCFFM